MIHNLLILSYLHLKKIYCAPYRLALTIFTIQNGHKNITL